MMASKIRIQRIKGMRVAGAQAIMKGTLPVGILAAMIVEIMEGTTLVGIRREVAVAGILMIIRITIIMTTIVKIMAIAMIIIITITTTIISQMMM